MADSVESLVDSPPASGEYSETTNRHPLDDAEIDVSGITHASVNDMTVVEARLGEMAQAQTMQRNLQKIEEWR